MLLWKSSDIESLDYGACDSQIDTEHAAGSAKRS